MTVPFVEYATAEEMLSAYRARLRPPPPVVAYQFPKAESASLKPRSGLTASQRQGAIAALLDGQSYGAVAARYRTTRGVVAGLLRRSGGRGQKCT